MDIINEKISVRFDRGERSMLLAEDDGQWCCPVCKEPLLANPKFERAGNLEVPIYYCKDCDIECVPRLNSKEDVVPVMHQGQHINYHKKGCE